MSNSDVMKFRVLSSDKLVKLKNHKYVSTGNTLLDPYMQIFWRWLVERIPLTWAPNAITLVGLIANIVSTVFLMIYCPNAHGYAPPYCYLLCAFCLFVYQSLDAIDGKQARRTNSSSALGELFDHGCDALSIVIIILGVTICSQLGTHPTIFTLVFFITASIFYGAQWRTLVTGVMNFSLLDVTEGQLAIMSLYCINAFFGHYYWNYDLIIPGLSPKIVLWVVGILFGLTVFSKFMITIVRNILSNNCDDDDDDSSGGTNKIKGNGSKAHCNKSTPSPSLSRFTSNHSILVILMSRKVSPAFPLMTYLFLGMACSWQSSTLMHNNIVLYHFMFGIISTKLCCKLLVSHMTKSVMGWYDSIFIGPSLLLLVVTFQWFNEDAALLLAFIYGSLNLLFYVYRVCSDICDYLNIYCFKITQQTNYNLVAQKNS